jgi:hypothetical protein
LTADSVGLSQRAINVLRANDFGTMTAAAPTLYPHMWSWDAAIIAIGLSHISVPRAVTELQSLLRAQWSTGMIPHVVFSGADGYFPGPDRWRTDLVAAAPRGVQTSGICQPPVHAIAVRRILDQGRRRGGDDRGIAEQFARSTFHAWLAWHRWLISARDSAGGGLIEIHHGWESGMDNSPRWDQPYAAVIPGPERREFVREDLFHVSDAAQRPTDAEYERYIWLIDQLQQINYDDVAAHDVADFRVADVFMSAVLSLASDVLATIGDEFGRVDEAAELREIAARYRAGVRSTISPITGLARDYDRRAGQWIETETLAGFAPLLCGIGSDDLDLWDRQRAMFWGERWCGHPKLAFPLPPSVSPSAPAWQPERYWRGPVWPVMSWLFSWALERCGDVPSAARLRLSSLDQLADGMFGEYYQPITGEALGSRNQSWTAAVTLDWLAL